MASALAASASLPIIMPSREVQGIHYRDGALADNTPAEALVAHGDCDILVVAHLGRGSLWDSHQYPGTKIIEVRPGTSLRGNGMLGGLTSLLDFTPSRLATLRQQGYDDATKILGPAAAILRASADLRRSQSHMLDMIKGSLPGPEHGLCHQSFF